MSHSVQGYTGKKMLLELAIKGEKDASDMLRTLTTTTVTAGAANEVRSSLYWFESGLINFIIQDLTVEKRNAMIIRCRRNLFATRQLFLTIKSKISAI